VKCAGIGLAVDLKRPADFALGNSILSERIGAEMIESIGIRGLGECGDGAEKRDWEFHTGSHT
jgi:hypothetical protein